MISEFNGKPEEEYQDVGSQKYLQFSERKSFVKRDADTICDLCLSSPCFCETPGTRPCSSPTTCKRSRYDLRSQLNRAAIVSAGWNMSRSDHLLLVRRNNELSDIPQVVKTEASVL